MNRPRIPANLIRELAYIRREPDRESLRRANELARELTTQLSRICREVTLHYESRTRELYRIRRRRELSRIRPIFANPRPAAILSLSLILTANALWPLMPCASCGMGPT